ncbi:MAG: ParB/RepB/Spo0J family partition protein [Actinomycetia bacterium]|nr:ParB/RepB/Spo0J family partition protein [Actinomycetes bacterium]
MNRRSGLGKGLGALIPGDVVTDESAAEGSAFVELPVASVEPNSYQPRKAFDEDSLSSLTASIRELGVLQPILVRQTGPERYELIAGERRYRAARRAGLQTIPALVKTAEDVNSLEQALVENLHREDLNAIEEAAAYQQLIEEFKLSQDEVATRVGKSRSAVANTLRLFQLPPIIQRYVADSRLTAGHARALLGTPDREVQLKLAEKALDGGQSVRQVERAVRDHLREASADEAGDDETTEPADDRPAALLELEELLSNLLDTRVRVKLGSKMGRVEIDFATLEDLERIYRAMVGEVPSDETLE